MRPNLTSVLTGSAVLLLSGAVKAQELPAYYPDDYATMIEASRDEGALLVYSNISPENWAPVLEGFNALYPWIDVETLDIGSGEVFSRFEAEVASGVSTADMLVSASPDRWLEIASDGLLADYESPETPYLPEFASAPGGIYTISTDPLVLIYNRQLLDEALRPAGLEDLVEIATTNAELFEDRVATYEATDGAFSLTVLRAAFFHHGDEGWDQLERLVPLMRVDTGSTASIVEKVAAGEYLAAYLMSGISFFPRLEGAGATLLGYAFPNDGAPVIFRGVGVTEQARNANSARLLLDYVLSTEGQTAIGQGGLTPYRDDVPEDQVPFYTYQAIEAEVGRGNMVNATYNLDHIAYTEEFLERWEGTVTDAER